MITICKSFTFDAAHRLDRLPPDHKCHGVHGHTYTVDIVLEGPTDNRLQWVTDYAVIAEAWAPVAELLDHKDLNEVEGLGHPTTEALAVWIWNHLAMSLPALTRLRVHESTTTWAEVTR